MRCPPGCLAERIAAETKSTPQPCLCFCSLPCTLCLQTTSEYDTFGSPAAELARRAATDAAVERPSGTRLWPWLFLCCPCCGRVCQCRVQCVAGCVCSGVRAGAQACSLMPHATTCQLPSFTHPVSPACLARLPAAIPGLLPDEVVAPVADSVGIRLLQKMGWRQGKGIGARTLLLACLLACPPAWHECVSDAACFYSAGG